MARTITRGGVSVSESYVYDPLNRLKTVTRSDVAAPTQKYCYDRWGNPAVVAGVSVLPAGTGSLTPQIADTMCPDPGLPSDEMPAVFVNNQWLGAGYDAAGNVTNDNWSQLAWDGENRLVGSSRTTAGTVYQETVAYDGEGRRVKRDRVAGGTNLGSTVYVYDAFGQLAAEVGRRAG